MLSVGYEAQLILTYQTSPWNIAQYFELFPLCAMSELQAFRAADVAKHSTKDDLWVVIRGKGN